MKRIFWLVMIVLLFVAACSQPVERSETPAPDATATLAEAWVRTTSVPDVKERARAYLDAWKSEDYPAMYQMLTQVSREAITEEEFTSQYRSVAAEAGMSSLDYEVLSALTNPDTSQVSYRVYLTSILVGNLEWDTLMNLRLERGEWHVMWDDTLIHPQLAGDNYMRMDLEIPARANIYDRTGKALVAQADATAIGLYPDNILEEQADDLFSWLVRLTGYSSDTIQAMYENFPPGGGWYLPLGEVAASEIARNYDALAGFGGLVLSPYKARYYFDGGIAPHVIGYVSAIQPEEVEFYKRQGYLQDERVGRSGLERWGEEYLAGTRGGTLYVFNGEGQPVTRLAESRSKPSQAIYTTLERDFQLAVQQSMGDLVGAIVVLERDTGRVLAMASNPDFDPNAFEPVNYNSFTLLSNLNDQNQPLYNRATQGQYPLGSVFKIITMATGIESGLYPPDYTYQCGHTFTELAGVTLYDWTLEKEFPPSGLLDLPGGLIRSCNPFFYHIGLGLFDNGLETAIPDMARGFGLGERTGIEGVEELPGQVPDPGSQLDATNLAIGQGTLQVTPLQVADFVAAVGNGGILYRPQVIERIAPPDGADTYTFEPQERGKLPVSQETLDVIHQAMVGVVSSTDPRGTAYHVFSGLNINVAAKTGTAQSGSGLPHAWFAGYTFEERENRPDIAIAVLVENIGDGSDYAAPIFRRVVEYYFRGSPGRLYPWESTYNVTRTPTPLFEEVPFTDEDGD
jgi:cell division protein FtsI/penicillin-binding protein 2